MRVGHAAFVGGAIVVVGVLGLVVGVDELITENRRLRQQMEYQRQLYLERISRG